ncbi:MAG: penicillin acylase family protein [Kofleriaceae bacterium]|nr:penicillin acylase family protein [Kofleriaceae bacterium]MCL4224481.1 penicillin acylase family protein [Myxococcales bacterium]
MSIILRRVAAAVLCAALALTVAACGDDDGGTPDGPTVEELTLTGLDGAVEVIVDDRGIPHIYATTVHDLLVVQGYLMARDRFAQMEFIRRSVTGRLAEVAGALSPGLVADDREQRFFGFARTGREIYEGLPTDAPSRRTAEAFVDGINQYIDTVLKAPGYTTTRGNEALALILGSPYLDHWQPADIFALARFQAWNLSYDAGADVSRTATRAAVAAAFPPTATDGRLLARVGLHADFFTDRPARAVFTSDGFPNLTTDTGSRARAGGDRRPGAARAAEPAPATLADPLRARALAGAQAFFDGLEDNLLLRRDPHVGSNSWVVAGDHTASGYPILSNDPHLSLIAPPVWWYVHLNTAQAGGERMVDALGVAFAGLPGVVLGFNRDLAWSATTTGYDVTDVYDEQIVFRNDGSVAAPVWVPVAARFRGADVPLAVIDETIRVQGQATPEVYRIHVVPHHGPIIPGTLTPPASGSETLGRALSVRYTGHEPSDELAFFQGLLDASTFSQVEGAQDHFRVGAQNFSFASAAEGIRWSTEARIPQRDPRACTFAYDADGVPTGTSPLFVLDGASGDHEWVSELDDRYIPHEVNPARGYIATANQDNVGVTADGNPCNDPYYLGGDFDVGYRQARIRQRLDALVAGDAITTDDMIALQAETRSSLGEGMRAALIASIDHALGDPSDDPALAAAMTELGASGRATLTDARARLMAWSFATPHGVGATDAAVIADSVGTTVFNAILTRLAPLAFGDENAAVGRRPGTLQTARALEWALTAPASMATYRTSYGGDPSWNDTVLWDDLATPAVLESRDERVVRAVVAGYAFLTQRLGADRDQWRWGRLHAVRFEQVVPALDGNGQVSVPPDDDPTYPDGFPRHGDLGAVDPGNYGIYDTTSFTFGSGASQRLVVEMTPAGPRAFNALPGGQREDPDSPHHADEAALWRDNRQPAVRFDRAEVEAGAVSRLRFVSR